MAARKARNPMEDAFKNKDFNKYEQGPGADLDDDLQPGALANQSNNKKKFGLCLKNVPIEMTTKAILNLCSNYGKVAEVNTPASTPYIFVNLATLADMERVLTGLKGNSYGIVAEPARERESNLNNSIAANSTSSNHDDSHNGKLDMSRRSIKGPFTNPSRLKPIEKPALVTNDDYNDSKLKNVDPQRHFLVQDDLYNNDRKNHRSDGNEKKESGRQIHTGRSYYIDSKETKDKLKRLSESSVGSYNNEKNEYVKNFTNSKEPIGPVGNCTLCGKVANKVCEVCGEIYCSVECQQKDWPEHKRTCREMPKLVSPDSCRATNRVLKPYLETIGKKETGNQTQIEVALMSPKTDDSSPRQVKQNNQKRLLQQSKTIETPKKHHFGNPRSPQVHQNSPNNETKNKGSNNNNQRSNNQPCKAKTDNRNSCNSNTKKEKTKEELAKIGPIPVVTSPEKPVENELAKNDSIQNEPIKDEPSTNKIEDSSDIKKESTIEKSKILNAVKTVKKSPTEKKEKILPIIVAELPESGSPVALTAIKKSNIVYVRSMQKDDDAEYIKGLNIVNTESEKAEFIKEIPERGDILAANFQDTGYYRALVLNALSEEKITVAYIDFGNVEEKKISQLKKLPPEVCSMKRYAIPVHLKNVPDFQPSEEILKYYHSFIDVTNREVKLIYEKSGKDIVEVELIDAVSNENINKKVLELKNVKVPNDLDAPILVTDIKMKLIPDGENVPVYVFDNSFIRSGYISCIHENDVLPLEAFNAQIKEFAEKSDEQYTPRQGEMCLVKYDEDGMWYRAECVEVVGDQNPSVIFTDYGNVNTVNIKNIRKYPKEFTYPCSTSICMIADLPQDMDDKLVARLKELIPMNERKVLSKVISDKEDFMNVIYLPDVITTLKAEKLL